MTLKIYSPLISVVMPTYDRENSMIETVEQLAVQDYPNYEVIIVDQTEELQPSTQHYLNSLPENFFYFRRNEPSLPKARNFGARVAQGDFILFIDDDIRIERTWISNHVKNFEDPTVGGVSGRVIEANSNNIHGSKVGIVTSLGRVVGNQSSTTRLEVEWASGGNSSFRKDLITKAGGFDENFLGNAIFEDVDFSFRIRRLGFKLVFDPEAKIIHLGNNEGGCQTRSKDRVEYYYWFLRNKSLFLFKNFPIYKLPLPMIVNLLRAIKVGLIESFSVSDTLKLFRAVTEGYHVYRKWS